MPYLLIMIAISILSAILIYLIFSSKIKIGGKFTGYIFITIMPLILIIVIPLGVIDIGIVLLCIGTGFKDSPDAIPLLIIIFEILLISFFTLIKLNFFPISSFVSKSETTSKKLILLDTGKSLLSYSIYGNLIYLTTFLILILYLVSKNHTSIGYVIMHPLNSIGNILVATLFMVFFPFMAIPFYIYAIIGFILISSFTFMFLIIFGMSMNGVIRTLYASSKIREKSIVGIGLMLITIINIFYMIKLHKLAKLELRVF